MLENMVINLSKGSHFSTSNYRMSMDFVQDDFKEEDTIHQMMGDMDIVNPKKPTTTMFLVDLNVLQSIRILGVFLRLYTYRKFWNVIAMDIYKSLVLANFDWPVYWENHTIMLV